MIVLEKERTCERYKGTWLCVCARGESRESWVMTSEGFPIDIRVSFRQRKEWISFFCFFFFCFLLFLFALWSPLALISLTLVCIQCERIVLVDARTVECDARLWSELGRSQNSNYVKCEFVEMKMNLKKMFTSLNCFPNSFEFSESNFHINAILCQLLPLPTRMQLMKLKWKMVAHERQRNGSFRVQVEIYMQRPDVSVNKSVTIN